MSAALTTVCGFVDGDRVRDRRSGCTGRIRIVEPTLAERIEGYVEAEVVWDGFCTADALDRVIEHGLELYG